VSLLAVLVDYIALFQASLTTWPDAYEEELRAEMEMNLALFTQLAGKLVTHGAYVDLCHCELARRVHVAGGRMPPTHWLFSTCDHECTLLSALARLAHQHEHVMSLFLLAHKAATKPHGLLTVAPIRVSHPHGKKRRCVTRPCAGHHPVLFCPYP